MKNALVKNPGQHRLFFWVVFFLILGGFTGVPQASWSALIERVSVDSQGIQGEKESSNSAISHDGRFIAFDSHSSNLVPDDTDGHHDVFVHDRETGLTERVSVDSQGTQANHGSFSPSLSGDGRFVAFKSYASNLVPGDTNYCADIFVHDRETGLTERVVECPADDALIQSTFQVHFAISADGRFVVSEYHTAYSYNNVNHAVDIFVYDRNTRGTEVVSVHSDIQLGIKSVFPSISANGRFISFQSPAKTLIPGDTNETTDIFVHDRETGETERVSLDSKGNEANGPSGFSFISSDGRFVAFSSLASNLVLNDTNGKNDIFVHDRQTKKTTRVIDKGAAQGNGHSERPSISGDGRFIVFESVATNLVFGDTNNSRDIFRHNRTEGKTIRINVDKDGNQADDDSMRPSISTDGRFVSFTSGATNLVQGDTNNSWDIFFVELDMGSNFGVTIPNKLPLRPINIWEDGRGDTPVRPRPPLPHTQTSSPGALESLEEEIPQ